MKSLHQLNNIKNLSFNERVVDFLPKMALLAYLALFFVAFKGISDISLSMLLLYAITVFIDFRTEF